jgi:hypothetical protein
MRMRRECGASPTNSSAGRVGQRVQGARPLTCGSGFQVPTREVGVVRGFAPKDSKMRKSNLFTLGMCSAVAAVAGSASAGVTIDSFTNSTFTQDRTSYGSIFNSRNYGTNTTSNTPEINTVTNRLVADTGNGSITTYWENYEANGNVGPFINLSQLSTITFDVTSAAASVISFGIQQRTGDLDASGSAGSVRWTNVSVGAGSSSVTLTVGQNSGGVWSVSGNGIAALSNVSYMSMRLGTTGAGAVGFVGSIGNLQYNLVPAPGAAALLGLAGLVGARRRKA